MEARNSSLTRDPFADPAASVVSERDLIVDATLAVSKHSSLTLGKEQLIVLDEDVQEQPRSKCGLRLPHKTQPTQSIPYFNILSATASKSDITICYAKPTSKKNPTKSTVFVQTLIYSLSTPYEFAEQWTARLLARAYGPAQRNKRIKVLINPFGGTGRAQKLYLKHAAPIFAAANCQVDVDTTTHRGHAQEIAQDLDIKSYDVLCCASGDGLPMESFNGLALKTNAAEALRKIAVVQLPCGSGNAMSWNLNGTDNVSLAALSIVKGVRTPLDLASVTQLSKPEERTLSFLSQSIGIVAETDLGTDNIRWMGDLRFTFGFLIRLLGKTVYPVDIAVKTEIEDKTAIKQHYANQILKRQALDADGQGRSGDILDHELESSTALGLPPLRYGNASYPMDSDRSKPASGKAELYSEWSPLKPYLNLGNFYCGNMCYMAADAPFFPASLPNDGMLDLVTIDGDIGRLRAIGLLFDVAAGRFLDQDVVRYRKVTAVRIVPRFGWDGAASIGSDKVADGDAALQGSSSASPPSLPKQGLLARLVSRWTGGTGTNKKEGYFSVDGEKLPFEPFQIELHRGLGTVLSRRWGVYEYAPGPKGWEDLALASVDGDGNSNGHLT